MLQRFLMFRYKDDVLVLPASLAKEIIELDFVAPLPGGRGGLSGLVVAFGQAMPLLDLHNLAGLPRHKPTLGLVVEISGEYLVFPLDEVVGNLETESIVLGPDMISMPQESSLYRTDYPIRIINPTVLQNTLQARLTPV